MVDNERFGATGSQVSHTAHGVDIAAIARACGFPDAVTIRTLVEAADVRARIHRKEGPYLCVAKVGPWRTRGAGPVRIRDGVQCKVDFMRALEASDA